MADREYTPHQKKIIARYYDNREQIDSQRLSELVTSLYLATGKKQLDKLWTSAGEAMQRLKVPPSRVSHVLQQRDPAILAAVVEDLERGRIRS